MSRFSFDNGGGRSPSCGPSRVWKTSARTFRVRTRVQKVKFDAFAKQVVQGIGSKLECACAFLVQMASREKRRKALFAENGVNQALQSIMFLRKWRTWSNGQVFLDVSIRDRACKVRRAWRSGGGAQTKHNYYCTKYSSIAESSTNLGL